MKYKRGFLASEAIELNNEMYPKIKEYIPKCYISGYNSPN